MNKVYAQAAPAFDVRRWWALAVLLLGTFMVILDSFIVNVAIPTIQSQLQANAAQVQFIVAAYVLSYAVLLIPGARLGDRFGRKKMFIAGMLVFTAASGLCGMATSAAFLIFARVLQGVGAAMLIPQVLTIIQVIFPPEEKGKAIGFYGAVSGLGLIAGQIIGGIILHWNGWGLGWRSVFLINLPIGIAAVLCIIPLVRDTRAEEQKSMDVTGIAILTCTLLLLIYPLVIGREAGWPLWVFISFAGAALSLVLLMVHEAGLARRGRHPLIPPGLFAGRAFTLGVLAILAYQIGNSGFFLVVSLTLQDGLALAAMASALAFVPIGAAFFLGSLWGPRWARDGRPVLAWGALALMAGYAAVVLVTMAAGAELYWQQLIVPFLLVGFGQGLVGAPLMGTIMSAVRPEHAGSASGILSTCMQTANALGVAVIGTLFFSALSRHEAGSGGADAIVPYLASFQAALLCSLGLALVTLLLVIGLRRAQRAQAGAHST